jgi:hypothetical protein
VISVTIRFSIPIFKKKSRKDIQSPRDPADYQSAMDTLSPQKVFPSLLFTEYVDFFCSYITVLAYHECFFGVKENIGCLVSGNSQQMLP